MCSIVQYPERPTINWEEFADQAYERRLALMKKYNFMSYSDTPWNDFKKWYWKTFPERKFYF